MSEKEAITKSECAMCQARNVEARLRIAEQVLSVRRELYLLLGTTTATIIIGAINLIMNLH